MNAAYHAESREAVEAECRRIFHECRNASWDGYRAEPVSGESLEIALLFLKVLPANSPLPEVCPMPDGCLSFEWRSESGTLLTGISPGGCVDFAFLGIDDKCCGSEQFTGVFPPTLNKFLQTLYGSI